MNWINDVDETWIPDFEPEFKFQSNVWKSQTSLNKKMLSLTVQSEADDKQ